MGRAALWGAGKCFESQSEWWLHSVFICTNSSSYILKVYYIAIKKIRVYHYYTRGK